MNDERDPHMVQGWDNEAAKNFVTMADIVIPDRRLQFEIVADLVPFDEDRGFAFIDIGSGEGLLAKAILDRFPSAVAHASDVAGEMMEKAAAVLAPHGDRVRLSEHNIHEPDYLNAIVPERVGFITSSLAVHHCTDVEKRALYRSAFDRLKYESGVIRDPIRESFEIR